MEKDPPGVIADGDSVTQVQERYERPTVQARLPLSDAEALLFLARALFFCDPRIIAHVVPQADATLGAKWSSSKYDRAFERAWELALDERNRIEYRSRNEAIRQASHILVAARTTDHELVLLKPGC